MLDKTAPRARELLFRVINTFTDKVRLNDLGIALAGLRVRALSSALSTFCTQKRSSAFSCELSVPHRFGCVSERFGIFLWAYVQLSQAIVKATSLSQLIQNVPPNANESSNIGRFVFNF